MFSWRVDVVVTIYISAHDRTVDALPFSSMNNYAEPSVEGSGGRVVNTGPSSSTPTVGIIRPPLGDL